MINIKNIINTKASHLFVAFCSSLQSLSSLSSFSSGQKSFKNLRPHLLTFLMKQALHEKEMKRNLFMLTVVAALLAACSQQTDERTSVFTNISEHHYFKQNLPDSLRFDSELEPYSEVKIFMEWPEKLRGKVPEALQKEIINLAFNDSIDDINTVVANRVKQPIFYEDVPSVTQEEVDSIPQEYSSFLSINVMPSYMGDRVYTYNIGLSNYMLGAAHGLESRQTVCYDLKLEKVIMLDDLVADRDKMVELIKSAIEADYGTDDNCIDYSLIDLTDNFAIDEYSISFIYNPYEVACYAQGEVVARIPFYEFFSQKCLTPYAKELFSIVE